MTLKKPYSNPKRDRLGFPPPEYAGMTAEGIAEALNHLSERELLQDAIRNGYSVSDSTPFLEGYGILVVDGSGVDPDPYLDAIHRLQLKFADERLKKASGK